MKVRIVIGLLAVFSSLWVTPPPMGMMGLVRAGSMRLQDAVKTTRTAIEGQYTERIKAAEKKDAKAYFAICTQDFVFITPDGGSVENAERLKDVTELMTVATSFKIQIKVKKVTLNGTGSATVEAEEKLEVVADNPEGGKKMTLTGESKIRDTWVLREDQWQLKMTQVLSTKSKLNGKSY